MVTRHSTSLNPHKPFIKKFENQGRFYIYCVNTNQIVEVEKTVYDIIDHYDGHNTGKVEAKFRDIYDISEIRKCISKIREAGKQHHLFSNFRPERITLGMRNAGEIKKAHEKGLMQLILQLTRACNLNCSYCYTSGKYADENALSAQMSHETCLKAVDFFCERAVDSRKPFISFYGGEPLLRFDLIKETVAHVRKKYKRKTFGFNLTTNGTLLDSKIIEFLVKYDFGILVSLDGPKDINDRYRVAMNGAGTFDTVIGNLEALKEYDLDYYTRRVSISSVLAPPFDNIEHILDFYATDKTLKEIRSRGKIRSSLVDTKGTSFIEDFNLKHSVKERNAMNAGLLELLKKSILNRNLKHLTMEKKTIYSILYRLARRPVQRLYTDEPPLGVCQMGLRKLFVGTNGDFYTCEKSDNSYKIGDLDQGFDYVGISGYYRRLEEVLDDCRHCWAMVHCDRCWLRIGDLGKFKGEKKKTFCSSQKATIAMALKVYTELLMEDPESLKVFAGAVIV